MASSGRYSAENSVAYQLGNAANIAAPAVISQTSLASHTGPMVFSAARLRCSGSAPLALPAMPERSHQHADPEVESLEEHEAEKQRGDDEEPQLL